MSTTLSTFAKNVHLTIVKHITDAQNLSTRIFWLICLVVVSGITVYQVSGFVEQLNSNSVLTSIKMKTHPTKPFPAVTFCSMNPYKKSALLSLPQFQALVLSFLDGTILNNPYVVGCLTNDDCGSGLCFTNGDNSSYWFCVCKSAGESCTSNADCCNNDCNSSICSAYYMQGSVCQVPDVSGQICYPGFYCEAWTIPQKGSSYGYCNANSSYSETTLTTPVTTSTQTTSSTASSITQYPMVTPVELKENDILNNPFLHPCTTNNDCKTNFCYSNENPSYSVCSCNCAAYSCSHDWECCTNHCNNSICTTISLTQGTFCQEGCECGIGFVCQRWGTYAHCNYDISTSSAVTAKGMTTTQTLLPVVTSASKNPIVSTLPTNVLNNPFLYPCTTYKDCNNSNCFAGEGPNSSYWLCSCICGTGSCTMDMDCCSNICLNGSCAANSTSQGTYCLLNDQCGCGPGYVCQPWGTKSAGYCNNVSMINPTTTATTSKSVVETISNLSTLEKVEVSTVTSKNPIISTLPTNETDSTILKMNEIMDILNLYNNTDALSQDTEINAAFPYLISTLSALQRMQLGYNIEDLMLHCKFDGKTCDKTDFVEWNDASIGNCFTFNHIQGIHHSTQYAGSEHGLNLLFNASQNDYLPTTDTAGMIIFITYNNATILPDQTTFSLPPGYIMDVSVAYEYLSRLQLCIGEKSAENYFYNEEYSVQGCLKTCYQKQVLAECGCGDPSYPLPPMLPQMSEKCSLIKKPCVDSIANSIDMYNQNCTCPQQCLENVFSPTPTLTKVRSDLNADLASINVYHDTMLYFYLQEIPAYSLEDFYNDFCNILGNNLEIGFHSVIEILGLIFFFLGSFFM